MAGTRKVISSSSDSARALFIGEGRSRGAENGATGRFLLCRCAGGETISASTPWKGHK